MDPLVGKLCVAHDSYKTFQPCLSFCFLVSCWGAMLIWSPCGNSHLCDCLRWWWTRWKRKPSENGHRRHRRKTANVRNRHILGWTPSQDASHHHVFFIFVSGILTNIWYYWEGGQSKVFWFWMFIFFDVSFFSPGRTRYLHYRPGLRPWRFWSKRGVPNLNELAFHFGWVEEVSKMTSTLFGEMIQIWPRFSNWLKPPTRFLGGVFSFCKDL